MKAPVLEGFIGSQITDLEEQLRKHWAQVTLGLNVPVLFTSLVRKKISGNRNCFPYLSSCSSERLSKFFTAVTHEGRSADNIDHLMILVIQCPVLAHPVDLSFLITDQAVLLREGLYGFYQSSSAMRPSTSLSSLRPSLRICGVCPDIAPATAAWSFPVALPSACSPLQGIAGGPIASSLPQPFEWWHKTADQWCSQKCTGYRCLILQQTE